MTQSASDPTSSPSGPYPTSTNREIPDPNRFRWDVCDTPFPSEETLERHRQEGHREVGQDSPTTGNKILE